MHIFAGNTRVASKLCIRSKDSSVPDGVYYYTSDHLGSSSVITDRDGNYYEHIEYFPYGEVWVNERTDKENYDLPYKYTGKEYDPETKLTYYGARYYDAQMSRWISVDPPLISGEYIGSEPSKLPGLGGVFNPINMNAYHYAGNNPVKLIDPDGNASKLPWSMLSGEVKAVMSLQAGLASRGNGEYFAESSGINSGYAYIGGMACGSLDSYLGLPVGKFAAMNGENKDLLKKHMGEFSKGYSHGSSAMSVYNTVMYTENLKKYAGKKLTAGVVKSQLKKIASDPKEFKNFTNGFIQGVLPEGKADFDNASEVYGYVAGKMGMEALPEEFKVKLVNEIGNLSRTNSEE